MPRPSNSDKPEVDVFEVETPASPAMTTEQLLKLVVSMQAQLTEVLAASAKNSHEQTAAIMELARPKEPLKTQRQIADEANEKLFRANLDEIERQTKTNEKYAHDTCEHIAGCNQLSETKDIAGRTSIIWHRGDVGQTTGICTVCQRIFKQSDLDFAMWRKKKSFNKDSASGYRTVMNPVEAIEKSYLHDID